MKNFHQQNLQIEPRHMLNYFKKVSEAPLTSIEEQTALYFAQGLSLALTGETLFNEGVFRSKDGVSIFVKDDKPDSIAPDFSDKQKAILDFVIDPFTKNQKMFEVVEKTPMGNVISIEVIQKAFSGRYAIGKLEGKWRIGMIFADVWS